MTEEWSTEREKLEKVSYRMSFSSSFAKREEERGDQQLGRKVRSKESFYFIYLPFNDLSIHSFIFNPGRNVYRPTD